MVDQSDAYVGLFIDWDNLAISVAADLSGASPDLKRIVQTAKSYGTILVARAYAEWNSTSERLSVYRAGIEPVYAPTFRFETDPLTQGTRGKSLADPCMVADCVDILHLHPKITTFVIVSGDKDLIPVVRLAQLRGKHVVVIGPDFSANVLREICDEFISYRSVIEAAESKTPEAAVNGQKSARRHPPVRMPQPGATARRSRPTVVPLPANAKSKQAEMIPSDTQEPILPLPVSDTEEPSPPDSSAESRDNANELATAINTMVEIIKQRTGEGKDRIRATNLKDALMVKLPGFSERKYGFSKFKDFLLAAEKTGVIAVSVAGPVHWVSLPAKPQASTESPASVTDEQQAASEYAELIDLTEERYSEIVRFIIDLRTRSRWLTYTYVLTNLISYLGRILPQTNAESAARSALNRLVQEGLIRIDREPQEVEVGGIKHRVRMCHLEEQHPTVAQMLAAIERERQASGERPAPIEASTFCEAEPRDAQVEDAGLSQPATRSGTDVHVVPHFPDSADQKETIIPEPAATPALAEDRPEPGTGDRTEHRDEERSDTSVEQLLTTLKTFSQEETKTEADKLPGQQIQETEEHLEPRTSLVGLSIPLDLEEAFATVQRVIRKSSGQGKARARLTGLKAKLTAELGHFDEQVYGFKRFKDFLTAAERAGRVKLEKVGPVVWVTLPEDAAPAILYPAEESVQGESEAASPALQAAGSGAPVTTRTKRRRSPTKSREASFER